MATSIDRSYLSFLLDIGPALEDACQRIDRAQLEKWESLLGLPSPNRTFRYSLRCVAALYIDGGDPVKADRETLTECREFLNDLGKCVRQMQQLLDPPVPLYRTTKRPRVDRGTLQYDALFAESMLLGYEDSLPLGRVRGQSNSTSANVRRYKAFQAMLTNVARLVEARATLLANVRVPPRRQLDRERWIARLLYNIFAQWTGENPADHVKSNTEKTAYTGRFFEFADEFLTRVGSRQQPAARGALVKSALRWARSSSAES